LESIGGKDALGQQAQFVVTPQNPPTKIAAGQTVTLIYNVTATWNTFKPPVHPIALSPTARASSDIAQQILDGLKDITKYQNSLDSTAKELPAVSMVLTAISDASTLSQLYGSKVILAEGFSFHLQGNGYSISDQFSNSESMWVLWEPYKTDVLAAYYIGIFTDLVPGIGDVDTIIATCAAPQNVAIIMGYENVMSNLDWYEKALEGNISYSDKLLSSP
jgi:hypothetical protein